MCVCVYIYGIRGYSRSMSPWCSPVILAGNRIHHEHRLARDAPPRVCAPLLMCVVYHLAKFEIATTKL